MIKPALLREEWDFRGSGPAGFAYLPEEQLPYAYEYEFARESKRIRQWVAQKLDPKPIACGFCLRLRDYNNSPEIDTFLLRVLELFPEWPHKPWLAVPNKERVKRLRMFPAVRVRIAGDPIEYETVVDPKRPNTAPQLIPCSDVFSNVSKLRVHPTAPEHAIYRNSGDKYLDHADYLENGCLVTYHVVRINWAQSPEWNAKAYRHALQEIRPMMFEDHKRSNLPKQPDARGAALAKAREQLRFLGAFRLRQALGSVTAAEVESNKYWTSRRGDLVPMYNSAKSWSEAKAKAEVNIHRFTRLRLFPPLDRPLLLPVPMTFPPQTGT